MNIPTAIKLLEIEDRRSYPKRRLEAHTALKLGIGALQQIAQMRLLDICPIAELLPGETKD